VGHRFNFNIFSFRDDVLSKFFFFVFSESLTLTFSVNKHPAESLQPPPPQFIRIHTLMESNKTRLKNKNNKNRFLLCFRPVTKDGRSPFKRFRRPDGPGQPAFTYIAMGEMEGIVFPKILPPDLAADIDKEEGDGGRRGKRSNGRLLRILKSVLSGTSSVSTSIVILVVPFSVYSVLWLIFIF
jgi:hypothetical protein